MNWIWAVVHEHPKSITFRCFLIKCYWDSVEIMRFLTKRTITDATTTTTRTHRDLQRRARFVCFLWLGLLFAFFICRQLTGREQCTKITKSSKNTHKIYFSQRQWKFRETEREGEWSDFVCLFVLSLTFFSSILFCSVISHCGTSSRCTVPNKIVHCTYLFIRVMRLKCRYQVIASIVRVRRCMCIYIFLLHTHIF